jgi:hypothetical protein
MRMRWAGYVARMGEVLVGKPESRRWEDGIRMDLREIGWEGVEWIQLAQNRESGGLL